MNPSVVVIDYGMCNLLNVVRAFEHCGARVTVAERPEQLRDADRVVLPGVGAFQDGMKELAARGFIEPVKAHAESGKPLLGICLGMQMLLKQSEEFGHTDGLGLIPGNVKAIPATTVDGQRHKIPHIGWNHLVLPEGAQAALWQHTVLETLPPHSAMYFVHSYMAVPDVHADRVADCLYGGHRVAAVIKRENVSGCQFHPEKSGEAGLSIVRQFILA